jgi:hypothetical protein
MPDIDPADPRWQLVQQIVQSAQFEKSPKLRSFLLFVCERVLTGHKAEINEQEIGVHVFGRGVGYNPGDDSIVRAQARILRQKLTEFFATSGSQSAMRIEIPKGAYIAEFKTNESARPSVLESRDEVAAPHRARRKYLLPGALIVIVLLVSVGVIAYRSQRAGGLINPEEKFWSSLFAERRGSVVVPADSTLVLIEEITGSQVSFEQYQTHRYLSDPALAKVGNSLRASDLAESRYTSMADLNLVARLMQTFSTRGAHPEIRYARDLSVSDAREKNLVLIGGARANPWVQLFAGRMNFTVDFDWRQRKNMVTDKAPKEGEAPAYLQDESDPLHRVYGLVAYEQSLDGEGDSLLIAGTSSAGTQAAGDFLLSSHLFADFLQRIQMPDGSIPHFEVLLEARDLNGNVAGSTIVASRVTH